MSSLRATFWLSLIGSLGLVWLYFGFYPVGSSFLPAEDGTFVNTLMKIVAIPLVLAIIVGGGLAVARLSGIDPDDRLELEQNRRDFAMYGPPALVWIGLMMVFLMVPATLI